MAFAAEAGEELQALEDEKGVYVGRKRSLLAEHGTEGALLLGKIAEKDREGKKVYLDALSPHVVFVCGARGAGKSYSLGVIAEEIALKNPNLAVVVIDPIGIFWSMKYPNRDEKEIRALAEWGLEPRGVDKCRVFVPLGMRDKVPPETYDRLFSLRVSDLTTDDWCLTFGLERFSPAGLLLGRAIEKARLKYKGTYGIEEIVTIIDTDKELTSKEKGFKPDTRRAVISRLESSRSWGVLSREGTSLSEICKEGTVSVIDISFLEENVSSLVIGMLSRKALNARKSLTRKTAIEEYVPSDMDELLEVEIPPTWLLIDEAHTLIPSQGKTAATDSLIEYVKQGRRPGCSLVFATQQPGAIDTKVLSQLDILLSHKLVFDEDLKAVFKRMPTLLPKEYENTRFMKTLPVGIGLIGDRSEETSRAFCVQLRPRFSQHEGRDSVGAEKTIDPEKIRQMLSELALKKLNETGRLSLLRIEEMCDAIGKKYNVRASADDITNWLVKNRGAKLGNGTLTLPTFVEESAEKVAAIKLRVTEQEARKQAEKMRRKRSLGVFGEEEKIGMVELVYSPVWRVDFESREEKGVFKEATFHLDAVTGVILESGTDISKILGLSSPEMEALKMLNRAKKIDKAKLARETGVKAKSLERLAEAGLIKGAGKAAAKSFDIPNIFSLARKIETGEAPKREALEPRITELKPLERLFGGKAKATLVYKPVWRIGLVGKGRRIVEVSGI